MLIQGYFYPSAPSIVIPEEGATVSGQLSTDISCIYVGSIALALRNMWTSLQEASARVSVGRKKLQPFSKWEPSAKAEGLPRPFHVPKVLCFRSHLSQERCQEWPLQRGVTQIVTSFKPGEPLQDKQEAITQHNVFPLGTSKQSTVQFKAMNPRPISWFWLNVTLKSSQMEWVY